MFVTLLCTKRALVSTKSSDMCSGNSSRTITEPCAVMADTSLAIVIIIIVLLALLIVCMLVYNFLYRHRGRSYYGTYYKGGGGRRHLL